jgi:hypothetical protein
MGLYLFDLVELWCLIELTIGHLRGELTMLMSQ